MPLPQPNIDSSESILMSTPTLPLLERPPLPGPRGSSPLPRDPLEKEKISHDPSGEDHVRPERDTRTRSKAHQAQDGLDWPAHPAAKKSEAVGRHEDLAAAMTSQAGRGRPRLTWPPPRVRARLSEECGQLDLSHPLRQSCREVRPCWWRGTWAHGLTVRAHQDLQFTAGPDRH